jgi:voltage-gated potassium channel
MRARIRIHQILEIASTEDRTSKLFDLFILSLVALNVVAVIVETMEPIRVRFAAELGLFEAFSVAVFSVEYLLRLWSCTADPRYPGAIAGRMRFAVTPLALVDLLAILPAYLPFVGIDLRQLRVLRLFRLLRVAKLVRYSRSLRVIARVFVTRRGELLSTVALMVVLLIVSASLLYFAERGAQPETFNDDHFTG